MKLSVTKQLSFSAAHRLYLHGGACRFLHGHNYVVEVTFTSQETDPGTTKLTDIGLLVDFSEIKRTIGEWIDINWDHAALLFDIDPMYSALLEYDGKAGNTTIGKVFGFLCNPTAEVMAAYLFNKVIPKVLPDNERYFLESVKVFETPTSWATVCK